MITPGENHTGSNQGRAGDQGWQMEAALGRAKVYLVGNPFAEDLGFSELLEPNLMVISLITCCLHGHGLRLDGVLCPVLHANMCASLCLAAFGPVLQARVFFRVYSLISCRVLLFCMKYCTCLSCQGYTQSRPTNGKQTHGNAAPNRFHTSQVTVRG